MPISTYFLYNIKCIILIWVKISNSLATIVYHIGVSSLKRGLKHCVMIIASVKIDCLNKRKNERKCTMIDIH